MGNRSLVQQVQDKSRLYHAIRHGSLEELQTIMANDFDTSTSNPVVNFYASAVNSEYPPTIFLIAIANVFVTAVSLQPSP